MRAIISGRMVIDLVAEVFAQRSCAGPSSSGRVFLSSLPKF